MKKRKKKDPYRGMLTQALRGCGGAYSPLVGYLHADGSTSEYGTAGGMSWTSFDRAISSCFGSAAKRLRGFAVGSRAHGGSPILAILMMVHSNGRIIWKHRFDIPEVVA